MTSYDRFGDSIIPEPAPFPSDGFPPSAPSAPIVPPVHEADYETRVEAARRAVEAMGYDMPATIVPEGSSLIEPGTNKLKRDRAKWDGMPLAALALPVIRRALDAEDRKDFDGRVSLLRLRPSDGRLVRAEKLAAPPTAVPGLAYLAAKGKETTS